MIALSGSEPDPPHIRRSAAIARSFCSTFGALNLRYKSTSSPTVLKCMLIASAVAPHPRARRSCALIRSSIVAPSPPRLSGMISRV